MQNIINDAETDIKEKKDLQKEREESTLAKYYTKYMQRSTNDVSTNSFDNNEAEIVPVKLIPYPPRRSRSLYFEREYSNNIFFEEGDSDNSDSLLSASNEQIPYYNNSSNNSHSKAHLELLQRESQKSYVKRRETFHYPVQKEEQTTEIKPELKNRRGSLDGVFYYNEIPPKGTKVYIDGVENNEKRLMSKSLDRIRDGLDTMVDIVVTDEITRPPTIVRPVPMQRSTQMTNNNSKNIYGMISSKKSDESVRYPADRTVFLPIKDEPVPTSTQQTFLLKRAPCVNAGLYSGQVNMKEPPCITTTINISDYYNKSLNGLNLSISGKLTDLPSGLY